MSAKRTRKVASAKPAPAARSERAAGAEPTAFIVADGKRIPLAKHLSIPADDTHIVYTDNEGKTQRILRTKYED